MPRKINSQAVFSHILVIVLLVVLATVVGLTSVPTKQPVSSVPQNVISIVINRITGKNAPNLPNSLLPEWFFKAVA